MSDTPHEYIEDEAKGQDCEVCGNSWYDVPHQVWLDARLEREAAERYERLMRPSSDAVVEGMVERAMGSRGVR